MSPYQDRVIEEKRELDTRLNSLRKFFLTDTFSSLEERDKELLKQQEFYMAGYGKTLHNRITRFCL